MQELHDDRQDSGRNHHTDDLDPLHGARFGLEQFAGLQGLSDLAAGRRRRADDAGDDDGREHAGSAGETEENHERAGDEQGSNHHARHRIAGTADEADHVYGNGHEEKRGNEHQHPGNHADVDHRRLPEIEGEHQGGADDHDRDQGAAADVAILDRHVLPGLALHQFAEGLQALPHLPPRGPDVPERADEHGADAEVADLARPDAVGDIDRRALARVEVGVDGNGHEPGEQTAAQDHERGPESDDVAHADQGRRGRDAEAEARLAELPGEPDLVLQEDESVQQELHETTEREPPDDVEHGLPATASHGVDDLGGRRSFGERQLLPEGRVGRRRDVHSPERDHEERAEQAAAENNSRGGPEVDLVPDAQEEQRRDRKRRARGERLAGRGAGRDDVQLELACPAERDERGQHGCRNGRRDGLSREHGEVRHGRRHPHRQNHGDDDGLRSHFLPHLPYLPSSPFFGTPAFSNQPSSQTLPAPADS